MIYIYVYREREFKLPVIIIKHADLNQFNDFLEKKKKKKNHAELFQLVY